MAVRKNNVTAISGKATDRDVKSELEKRLFGQQDAINAIVPYVELFQSGLSQDGRPIGVFLLLGPTGTGKTHTVESLAEVLHGSHKNVLKVDCGEFQMEHEVAKLIGAPPGYLGHRETQPILSQQRLASVVSDKCALSLVLFDEIEKAAPSMTRLLLGVLDKATLRLGDNSTVNFEKSLIFLTSNLGATEMAKQLTKFGFDMSEANTGSFSRIATNAAKRKFSPEFMNRIDVTVTYKPLDDAGIRFILEDQLTNLRNHVSARLGARSFSLHVTEPAKKLLLEQGTSKEYGARELKRVIFREIIRPLANQIVRSEVGAGDQVVVGVKDGELDIWLDTPKEAPKSSRILIVENNKDLRTFLHRLIKEKGFDVDVIEVSDIESRSGKRYDAVVTQGFDAFSDCDKLQALAGDAPVIGMACATGEYFPPGMLATLRKPFLATDLMKMLTSLLLKKIVDEAA